ncbi:retrovirus-related pol polyprotein from transposon TNT 1-94 [Tanacetum coccineum]
MEPKETLVDLPHGKKAIGTKWVFRNKTNQRGIVVRNKARLVAQGYRQEEGVDYDEVFTPVARIEAIRLVLAFALFMGFTVYQMDVKSAFLYGTIEEEVYVNQPLGFVDPEFPNSVYKVEKALYGLHQAPRVEQRKDSIFLSQDKYMYDILKKFGFSSVKTVSTPMETHKPLSKDIAGTDVDVHLYRSMIGSLMYLTSSRPDIMFVVCACSRFQVQPKASHIHAVKRIFRYLKGQPTLGLWYPKDSPMDLISYSDSDYAGASIDRKSTTRDYNVADLLTKAFDCDWKDLLHQTKSVKHIGKSKEVGTLRYLSLVVPLTKVGDEAVHKELGDRMERAATTASSLEAEQDSDAQTRFEAASKSPMIHLSQELTHLDVGRTI